MLAKFGSIGPRDEGAVDGQIPLAGRVASRRILGTIPAMPIHI